MMMLLFGDAVTIGLVLYAGPSVTYNAAGNILATSTSIAASGSSSGNIVDFSTASFGGFIQIIPTGGGTVAATNGCKVEIYAAGDSTPNYDSEVLVTFTIVTVVSTTKRKSTLLPTGKYSVKLTNLDATNAITAGISSAPVS